MGLSRPSSAGSNLNHKAQRVATGAVAAVTAVDVTVTWTLPFADTAYTVTVSIEETAGGVGNSLQVRRIKSKTASAVVVQVFNNEAVTARSGTLHAIAVHD